MRQCPWGGVEDNTLKPISFTVDGLDLQVDTRTSEVTTANLSSFNVICYKDVFDAIDYFDAVYDLFWTSTATKTGSIWTTNKYWPNEIITIKDPAQIYEGDGYEDRTLFGYYFVASNLPTTDFCDNGVTNIPDRNTDWIMAATGVTTAGSTVPLTFNHLLSRIGTITVNAPTGYSITVNEMNFATCEYVSGGMGDGLALVSLSAGSNDVWVIADNAPYDEENNIDYAEVGQFYIDYTLTKGDFSKRYTKRAALNVVGGKTHNLTINITTDEAQGIQLNSIVTAWAAQATSLTIN